jgi:hypothetical protein
MAKGKKGPPVDDPIINDEGEIVEQVWVERLPKSERNAHWKNARLIEAPKAVTA